MSEGLIHYCAGCGRVITTMHFVIPPHNLRYHVRCRPKDEPVEILVHPEDDGGPDVA